MPEIFFGLLSALLPLGLIAAVAYGIFALTRRRRDFAEIDPGIGAVRRLYFYIVSFVALMMAANGVVQIAQFVLDALVGVDVISPSRTRLAIGLSLTIVGLPLWALHWRMIGKHVRELAVETRSMARKAYMYVVLGVAAGFAAGAAVEAVQWALRTESFSGYPWAALVVWVGVWAFHWRLESREGQPSPETRAVRRLYLYLLSAGALVAVSVGLGLVTHTVLREAYDALTSRLVAGEAGLWTPAMRDSLSLLLVAGLVWAMHWLVLARHDYGSVLRQIYLYALTIFGSIVTVLIAASIVLYGVLVWALGVPDDESAAEHFRFLPGALATIMVGGGILAYHSLVAWWEAAAPSPESVGARRSYPYALSLLGLLTLAAAMLSLVSTAILILIGSGGDVILGQDLWRKGIALTVTLGVLGGPIWLYYWAAIQRRVRSGDLEELTSPARRQFIFVVLGAGMLTLLTSVSAIMVFLIRDVLDASLSGQTVRDARFAIAFMVPAAVILPYYWLVYRSDRRDAPEDDVAVERAERKAVTVLVGDDGAGFLRELEAALGYSVSLLRWADPDAGLPDLTDDELQALAHRIGAASGPNVLLVPDGTGVRLLSYR
jgi:hypothetical protein